MYVEDCSFARQSKYPVLKIARRELIDPNPGVSV
jgi:hypothetical protein